MTNSLHGRHFPGSEHCGRTCHPGSSANIAANRTPGPSVFCCLWVERDRSCLSGPQQMCWDQAVAHGHLHPSNRCPSVSSESLPSVWTGTETTNLNIFLMRACFQEAHIFSGTPEVTKRPELTMCQGLERDKESPCFQLYHKEAWSPNVLCRKLVSATCHGTGSGGTRTHMTGDPNYRTWDIGVSGWLLQWTLRWFWSQMRL